MTKYFRFNCQMHYFKFALYFGTENGDAWFRQVDLLKHASQERCILVKKHQIR